MTKIQLFSIASVTIALISFGAFAQQTQTEVTEQNKGAVTQASAPTLTPPPAAENNNAGPAVTPNLTGPTPPPASASAPAAPSTGSQGAVEKQPPGPPVTPSAAQNAPQCVRQFVSIPGIKEPARIVISIHDTEEGLVEKMKACNGDLVQPQQPGKSTKSVLVNTTQGADGWATIRVPSDRKQYLLARFHSSDPRLKDNPFWESGPFGDATEVKLAAAQPGPVVGKVQP